jgi:hypothetical protein
MRERPQVQEVLWGNELTPNPSIERTCTGLAHSTPKVYSPFRGPSRFRPAHVKR